MIEGPEKGLYKKYKEMKNDRDAPMKDGGWSYRAGWFWCEEDAKNWVQAVAQESEVSRSILLEEAAFPHKKKNVFDVHEARSICHQGSEFSNPS